MGASVSAATETADRGGVPRPNGPPGGRSGVPRNEHRGGHGRCAGTATLARADRRFAHCGTTLHKAMDPDRKDATPGRGPQGFTQSAHARVNHTGLRREVGRYVRGAGNLTLTPVVTCCDLLRQLSQVAPLR